ncbi:NBR1-Ig-like domain-containing protein [Microbispora sp. NPDC049125]|uniref:NBR1-Ig-like domain-containing protein n=1 Tax=Microbispora sp. NPDC049125 TaxID=3154929 RepID=UPI003466AE6F
MHEATKGNRLPSWETTVEFVKACGADPAAYRERWERASLTVRSASAGDPSIRSGALPARPPDGLAASATGAVHVAIGSQEPRSSGQTSASAPPSSDEIAGGVQPVPARRGRGRFRLTRPVAAVVAAAVVAAVTAVCIMVINRGSGTGEPGSDPSGGPSNAALLPAADCPVRPTNPPWAPPAHEGDSAAFIGDIKLPDCTRVGPGQTMTKVWRLKNIGTVPWKGYSLHRLDLPLRPDQCQTISDVPIPDTRPGQIVDIQTEVTTPRNAGLCYVRFKVMDGAGQVAFPGGRPLNFQIIVG